MRRRPRREAHADDRQHETRPRVDGRRPSERAVAAPRSWHRRPPVGRRGRGARLAPRVPREVGVVEGDTDAQAAQTSSTGGPSGRSRCQATASSSRGPARTSSPSRRSSTDRARGPPELTSVSIRLPGGPGMWPRLGTMPHDGLDAVHATEVRRRTDRSADVAAQLERADARGDRGRGSARRTARCA